MYPRGVPVGFFISQIGEWGIIMNQEKAAEQMTVLFAQGLFNQRYEAETMQMGSAKIMIDSILKKFENIREWVQDMEAGGDIFKSYAMSYSSGRGSSVEYNIISVSECSRIKDSIETSITLLDDDSYELLVKKYWDRVRIRDVARSYKVSENTIRDKADKIQEFIVHNLEQREVTFQNLYWFWDKFFGTRQEKAG